MMTNAKQGRPVSLKPSDFEDEFIPLPITLGEMSFQEAIDAQWRGIGKQDDRRSDTKATVHMLRAAMVKLTPTNRGIHFVSRLSSLGGCDLLKKDEGRKKIRKLRGRINTALGYIEDCHLHDRLYRMVGDVGKSMFRWDAWVDKHKTGVHIELWSPLVKDENSTASDEFVVPVSVITQVFQIKWLLASGAELGEVSRRCFEDTVKEWDKRNKKYIEDAEELLEEVEKLSV